MEREFRVKLHPAQSAIFNSSARFTVTAAGRRFGKSYLAATKLGIEFPSPNYIYRPAGALLLQPRGPQGRSGGGRYVQFLPRALQEDVPN